MADQVGDIYRIQTGYKADGLLYCGPATETIRHRLQGEPYLFTISADRRWLTRVTADLALTEVRWERDPGHIPPAGSGDRHARDYVPHAADRIFGWDTLAIARECDAAQDT